MGDSAGPIRKFIWDIGNGTSETSLCETLELFFHTICPLADILDKDICKDYKRAYEARCAPNAHRLAQEGTFLYVAIVLIFCFSLASLLKSRRVLVVPDSAVTIGVGFVTGAMFVVSRSNHSFNEQIFFEVLLPFIIFEAGYNMDKRRLGSNLNLITGLAIFGTFASFAATTGLMIVGNGMLNTGLTTLDCAMFGALISSTDPIAIVNVFSSLGVDPELYALVLGESALNDGVAVALYASMKHFYTEPNIDDVDAAAYVASTFIIVGLGSFTLGFTFGLGTALFWRVKGRSWFVQPVLETLCFLACAIVPYYVADGLKWSGVISILAASLSLSIYAHPNLSETSQLHVVFVVECVARLCEAVMFGYVGTQIVVNNEHMVWTPLVLIAFVAVLISRAVAVFPIIGLHNCLTKWSTTSGHPAKRISFSHQAAIWFSGLRGALSFALAITVPEYDTVLKVGSKHSGQILACTCFVILMNVFVMGSLAPFVLGFLLRGSESRNPNVPGLDSTSMASDGMAGTGWIAWIDERILKPILMGDARSQDKRSDQNMVSPDLNLQSSTLAATPDESGYIHLAFDDEGTHPVAQHTIIFSRSRLVIPTSAPTVSIHSRQNLGGQSSEINSLRSPLVVPDANGAGQNRDVELNPN